MQDSRKLSYVEIVERVRATAKRLQPESAEANGLYNLASQIEAALAKQAQPEMPTVDEVATIIRSVVLPALAMLKPEVYDWRNPALAIVDAYRLALFAPKETT